MTERELLTRIRALLRSGELPAAPPELSPGAEPPAGRAVAVLIGGVAGARCLICRGAGPSVSYAYREGRRIHVHWSPCDAAWRAEAGARRMPAAG